MGDAFEALQERVAASPLATEDKAALLIAVQYLKCCALAAVLRDGRGGESAAIRSAQELLGQAARAMQAVRR